MAGSFYFLRFQQIINRKVQLVDFDMDSRFKSLHIPELIAQLEQPCPLIHQGADGVGEGGLEGGHATLFLGFTYERYASLSRSSLSFGLMARRSRSRSRL